MRILGRLFRLPDLQRVLVVFLGALAAHARSRRRSVTQGWKFAPEVERSKGLPADLSGRGGCYVLWSCSGGLKTFTRSIRETRVSNAAGHCAPVFVFVCRSRLQTRECRHFEDVRWLRCRRCRLPRWHVYSNNKNGWCL
uniref:Putative secreted protein n=1 Tax=Ixodes ricinus TaxID=34613 RepID=A0A147BDE8_IXORI